ncbi:CTD kinase subunit gamma [Stagonosporopsis vannaccii]|nr:CTD kinase subunit gamma [Stagonosporopsis vannaccii]
MADPFEVRQRFTTLLSHLSASHTSIQKAAVYALKNRDMDEDLHSCILEQLDRTNMNTRANIMFFIESLCEMAVKDGGPPTGEGSAMGFVRMLQRDILPVVESVIGVEGANVRVVRKVLNTLQKIDILLPETVTELDAVLKSREPDDPFDASPSNVASTKNVKLDKRQIEHRIEEDRERHKRLRESIWAVPGEGEEEMHKLWDEASDIGEDDYIIGKEDKEEREQAIAFG